MVRRRRSHFTDVWHWLQINGLVLLVHLSALFLLVRLVWFISSGKFFIDPVRQTTTQTGKLAIAYLFLSLSCTPAVILTGWSAIIRARKPLGLYAFGFALLHGMTYVIWDYGFNLYLIMANLRYELYILVGASAFLVLLLLAVTSLRSLHNKMGKTWKKVQRLVYLAGGLAVIHVFWLRKTPQETLPLLWILLSLFIIRVPWVKQAIIKLRISIVKGFRRT